MLIDATTLWLLPCDTSPPRTTGALRTGSFHPFKPWKKHFVRSAEAWALPPLTHNNNNNSKKKQTKKTQKEKIEMKCGLAANYVSIEPIRTFFDSWTVSSCASILQLPFKVVSWENWIQFSVNCASCRIYVSRFSHIFTHLSLHSVQVGIRSWLGGWFFER